MLKVTEIYAAVSKLLKSKYKTYKIYGKEVKEGYDKPSFFVNLIPKNLSNDSIHFKKKAFTIMITYFQKVSDEVDNLKKVDELEELFGLKLDINGRKISVLDFDYEFVGDDNDILQFSIEIEFFDTIERVETQPVGTNINLK